MLEEKCEHEEFYNKTWIRRFWRPAMCWQYFTVCMFDFLLAPVYLGWINSLQSTAVAAVQWTPITLQGGGMYHIAMGAIVGAYAYGRTRERLMEMKYGRSNGYEYNQYNHYGPYQNQPQMIPNDKFGDGLSNNEDEIIPSRHEV